MGALDATMEIPGFGHIGDAMPSDWKPARRLEIERAIVEVVQCTPEQALIEAEAMPAPPRYLCASDYFDSIHVLRERGLTWNDCRDWLAARGVNYSMQSVRGGWYAGLRRRGLPIPD